MAIDFTDSRITAHVEPRTATTRDGVRSTALLIEMSAREIPEDEKFYAWIAYPGCVSTSTGVIIIDGVEHNSRFLTYEQFMDDLPKAFTDAWIAKMLELNPAFMEAAPEKELTGSNEKKSK